MPCCNPLHNHDWPTTGELMIWHCERQCGYCLKSNFNQTSHLRAHVKQRHENEMPGLEVVDGKLGNEGKYPTERHKSRKEKIEQRSNRAAKASAGNQSPKEAFPEQFPLPDAHVHLGDRPTAPSQSLAYYNTAATDFTGTYPATIASDVIDHASPAPTYFSDYHSAAMSRDPSLTSRSAYEQVPAQQRSMKHQQRLSYGDAYSTGMEPAPSTTAGFCPPGYRPAGPFFPFPMRPRISKAPVAQGNQPVQAQLNLEESRVMLPETLPTATTTSFNFVPCEESYLRSILLEHPVHVDQPWREKQMARAEHLVHVEHPNPMKYDNDDSLATTEALEAVDSKVDELLNLIATHQDSGVNGDSLRARVLQRLLNLGQMTQAAADFSTIE